MKFTCVLSIYLIFICSNIILASKSSDNYELVKSRMPLLQTLIKSNGSPKINKSVLVGLPLTFETLSLVEALNSYFDKVIVIPQSSGKNSSLQPGVFKHLDRLGVKYFTESDEENRIKALSLYPDIIIDCSFMLGEVALKFNLMKKNVTLIEDTKTGENRYYSLLNKYENTLNRFIVLDNSQLKRLYENSLGIGYSVIGALMSLGFFVPNYKIGVVGYGYVGSGVADLARKMGAKHVFVSEIDQERQKSAIESGFQVSTLEDLLNNSDIVITSTGQPNVIEKSHLESLNKSIILANAGGEEEWDRFLLFDLNKAEFIHEHILKFKVGDCSVWELGGGNSINLVMGVSITEFLDITFAEVFQIAFDVAMNDRIATGHLPISAVQNKNFVDKIKDKYGRPKIRFSEDSSF